MQYVRTKSAPISVPASLAFEDRVVQTRTHARAMTSTSVKKKSITVTPTQLAPTTLAHSTVDVRKVSPETVSIARISTNVPHGCTTVTLTLCVSIVQVPTPVNASLDTT